MIEAGVGVAMMPESAARRYALAIPIEIVAQRNTWALREMHVCVRSLEALPGFARDLIELLAEDAREGERGRPFRAPGRDPHSRAVRPVALNRKRTHSSPRSGAVNGPAQPADFGRKGSRGYRLISDIQ